MSRWKIALSAAALLTVGGVQASCTAELPKPLHHDGKSCPSQPEDRRISSAVLLPIICRARSGSRWSERGHLLAGPHTHGFPAIRTSPIGIACPPRRSCSSPNNAVPATKLSRVRRIRESKRHQLTHRHARLRPTSPPPRPPPNHPVRPSSPLGPSPPQARPCRWPPRARPPSPGPGPTRFPRSSPNRPAPCRSCRHPLPRSADLPTSNQTGLNASTWGSNPFFPPKEPPPESVKSLIPPW